MTQPSQTKKARIIVAEAVAMRQKLNKQDVIARIAISLDCSIDRATSRFNHIMSSAGLSI